MNMDDIHQVHVPSTAIYTEHPFVNKEM